VTWFGPTPRVIITEPELVRQVLSNKFGHFEKVGFGQLTRLLHYGVSTHQGSKWAKHRRIINPAFHLDKLKVSSLIMHHVISSLLVDWIRSELFDRFSCSACCRPSHRAAPTW